MSKKNTYYFSHDCNARSDGKILAVRMRHKAEGYAVYFMIVEMLAEEPTHTCLKDYNILAFEIRVGAEVVKSVVEDFGLFQFTEDGERFYSESLMERMAELDNIREKRREAGRKGNEKRWGKSQNIANATDDNRNCDDLRPDFIAKERKGKERKEKKTPGGVSARTREKGEALDEISAEGGMPGLAIPEGTAMSKEKQERQLHIGIMQGWKQHYLERMHTEYMLTRGSIAAEVADLAPAIGQLMRQCGRNEADSAEVQAFCTELFNAMYDHADSWQREKWALRVIGHQFNELLKPIINADSNNNRQAVAGGRGNTKGSGNARDNAEYLASLVAELYASQEQ